MLVSLRLSRSRGLSPVWAHHAQGSGGCARRQQTRDARARACLLSERVLTWMGHIARTVHGVGRSTQQRPTRQLASRANKTPGKHRPSHGSHGLPGRASLVAAAAMEQPAAMSFLGLLGWLCLTTLAAVALYQAGRSVHRLLSRRQPKASRSPSLPPEVAAAKLRPVREGDDTL